MHTIRITVSHPITFDTNLGTASHPAGYNIQLACGLAVKLAQVTSQTAVGL
jgi:hypothetical protein